MAPEITYDPKLDVVHVKYSGTLNNETGMAIAKKAVSVSAQQKCDKILFDYRKTDFKESTLGIYQNPKIAVKEGIPRSVKIAVVYSTDETLHLFWETVTINSGYIAKCFKTEDKAITWLKE